MTLENGRLACIFVHGLCHATMHARRRDGSSPAPAARDGGSGSHDSLATQGLIFSPYWVKVRGDSYGPLYSRQRDVLGNEENVYVWDYHMDIYNPMSAVLVLGLTTAFLCVLSFIYNNLFEHNFRRKIVALIFSFSFLGFQTAISVLPTTIHTAKLWWTYYVYVSLGVLCSVVFILLTGMDYTAKIKDSKAE